MLQALEVEKQKKQQALHDKAEQMKQQPMQFSHSQPLSLNLENEAIPLMHEKNSDTELEPATKRSASFIAKIEKAASNHDAQVLITEILKQSEELENINQDKSLKLLAIAEGIIEDYKTAGIMDMLRGKKPEEAKKEEYKEAPPPLV